MMKKAILAALLALGLTQIGRTANLEWNPTDANWDFTTSNWKNTDTTAMVPFANGDNVVFNDNGVAQTTVALGANLLKPNSILVDSWATYTLSSAASGKLTNVVSLTKRGGGTLILDCDNSVTGSTSIQEGALQIGIGPGSASRGSLGTAPIINNSVLIFNRTNVVQFSNNIAGSGTLSMPTTATGTWYIRGTNTMTDYSIEHNGAILYFTNSWNLGSPTNILINASAVNERLQMGGGINLPANCPITIIVASGDQLTRASLMSQVGSNSVSGPIIVAGGAPTSTSPNVNLYSQGTTAEFVVNSSVSEIPWNPYVANFYLRGNSTVGVGKLYGTINLPQATLCKDETSTWTIYSTGNKASLTFVNGGRLNLGVANALPEAQLTLNATLNLGGFDQKVGSLYSAVGTVTGVITNSSATDALLTLVDGGVYYGTIKDSGSSGKVGLKILSAFIPHAQQLFGVCTYSGPTTLQPAAAIALMSSGSIPNTTPIDMGNGSSIDVTSKSDKKLTIGAAQTLKGDGTFNVAGGDFQSLGTMQLNVAKTGGTVTCSKLNLDSGKITLGGTLSLNITGDEPLSATDTLTLLSATGGYDGAFASIVPAKPGSGLAWDTTTLTTDGVLRIVASIPTNRTNITYSVVSGGTELQIAWPSDYTGWTLQGQTNALTVGINSTWFNVPDSANTNRIVLPIDPKNGAVFYRLYYTKP